MSAPFSPTNISRRHFLKQGSRLSVFSMAGSLLPFVLRGAERSTTSRCIGIQVGAVSFVDEGTDKVLAILQERGAVDTVYLTTFTYGRGLAGRQIPGQTFPDHGVQESDEKSFRGGLYS